MPSDAPSGKPPSGKSPPGEPPSRQLGGQLFGSLRAAWRALSPPQLFVGSFLTLILIGTAGFRVLPGLYTGAPLGWVDALFTATSAACVTGLIVVDTATYFTAWGQAYVLLLIQLGGLGMLTFTSVILVALGQRLSLRQEVLAGGEAEVVPALGNRDLVYGIVRFTAAAEAVGALLLYACWVPRFGWTGAAGHAVFHAVSAFCNAGFSTFSASLTGFRGNLPLLTVVMGLIIIGGLGFLTLEELSLWGHGRRGGRRFRLSLHSQIVLGSTVAFIVGGWALFTAFEWQGVLAGLPLGERLVSGLFASVTPRTAGFSVFDYGQVRPETSLLTVIFMTIGGAPGSTAGGLKVTTVALLGLLAWSRLRGAPTVALSGRTVPEGTFQKAMGLFVVGVGVAAAGVFALTLLEFPSGTTAAEAPLLPYLFEAVSAFNTVGLSMGVTGDLSAGGRLLSTLLMFVGRVGPLTFAAAMARERARVAGDFRYAREDVAVG